MPNKITIEAFENDLEGLQGSIALAVRHDEIPLLLDFGFPGSNKLADDLQAKLTKIGMYEPVKAALATSEALVRVGRYADAEDVILEVNRALMKASGTWDRMRKYFAPKV